MNIKNILNLAGLLIATMIASSQKPQSLVGFQGIPWGSSVQIVKAKSPQLKAWDECRNSA